MRQHANAQRRLDQIYGVDLIEAPPLGPTVKIDEKKVVKTVSVKMESNWPAALAGGHRRGDEGRENAVTY